MQCVEWTEDKDGYILISPWPESNNKVKLHSRDSRGYGRERVSDNERDHVGIRQLRHSQSLVWDKRLCDYCLC